MLKISVFSASMGNNQPIRWANLRSSFPYLLTVLGPNVGTFVLMTGWAAPNLSDQVSLFPELHWAVWLLIGGLFQSVGLMHGTTIPAVLGLELGYAGLLVWPGVYALVSWLNFYFSTWLLRTQGDVLKLLEQYPKLHKVMEAASNLLYQQGPIPIFWLRLNPMVPFGLGGLLLARGSFKAWQVAAYGVLGALPRTAVVMISAIMAGNIYRRGVGATEPWVIITGIALVVVSTLGISYTSKRRLSSQPASPTKLTGKEE